MKISKADTGKAWDDVGAEVRYREPHAEADAVAEFRGGYRQTGEKQATIAYNNATAFAQEVPVKYYENFLWFWKGKHWAMQTAAKDEVRKKMIDKGVFASVSAINLILENLVAIALKSNKNLLAKDAEHIPFNNAVLVVESWINGVLHTKAHTPEIFNTFVLPYDFDVTAGCEAWLKFLDEVFEGNKEKIALLQEWFGYCLTGDISFQKFLMMVGVIRAGKSTIQRILMALVGKANGIGMTAKALLKSFTVACLVDKNVACIGEFEKCEIKVRAEICEMIKNITGGGEIPIERKGKDIVASAVLPCKISISCNSLMDLFDASGGLAERALILKFNRSFIGKEDHKLSDKLLAELPGIAVWALHGLTRLRQQGWTEDSETRKDKEKFKRQTSDVLAFLETCCLVRHDWKSGLTPKVETTHNTECRCSRAALRRAFRVWKDLESGEKDYFKNVYEKDIVTVLPHFNSEHREAFGNSHAEQYVAVGLKLKPRWENVKGNYCMDACLDDLTF